MPSKPPHTVALVKVDERQLEGWIADLRRIVIGGQVSVIAAVGEYLIAHVYGDEREASSRRPGKAASIERLAARAEEFGMTAAGLTRAVPIALQVRQLGKRISSELGVRHHRALLPLKDPAEKKVLAESAVEAQWTAEELGKKVRELQKPHAGGRAAVPPLVRLVERAAPLFDGAAPGELRRGLEMLEPGRLRHLLARVHAMQGTLERVEKLLGKALPKK